FARKDLTVGLLGLIQPVAPVVFEPRLEQLRDRHRAVQCNAEMRAWSIRVVVVMLRPQRLHSWPIGCVGASWGRGTSRGSSPTGSDRRGGATSWRWGRA